MLQFIRIFFINLFQSIGFSETFSRLFTVIILFAAILVVGFICFTIIKQILTLIIKISLKKRDNKWVRALFEQKFFTHLSVLLPALLINKILPSIFIRDSASGIFFRDIINIIIIINITIIICAFLNGVTQVFSMRKSIKDKPIKSYLQVVKIVFWGIASILIISIIVDKSPAGLLAGIGAFSAVLLLVFQDTITGFVNGIQLSANDMVRVGDWITISKYGVDGNVEEINLVSVKVRNFDNTIVSVPVKQLVADSFQNWRGMVDKGCRRVMRSINIDVTSIKPCTPEMLQRFGEIELIKDYVTRTQTEIDEYNAQNQYNTDIIPNGRHQTNLGVLRAYLIAYLQNNPHVDNSTTLMVRQLKPTEFGIPLELYCFIKTTEWVAYEQIQSDLFDHFYTILPFFEIKAFQRSAEKIETH